MAFASFASIPSVGQLCARNDGLEDSAEDGACRRGFSATIFGRWIVRTESEQCCRSRA